MQLRLPGRRGTAWARSSSEIVAPFQSVETNKSCDLDSAMIRSRTCFSNMPGLSRPIAGLLQPDGPQHHQCHQDADQKICDQTLVMGLVQCWARQVASDHDIDETLTNIIPAFDYFAFTDPSRL